LLGSLQLSQDVGKHSPRIWQSAWLTIWDRLFRWPMLALWAAAWFL
jgi:hypothetical protein